MKSLDPELFQSKDSRKLARDNAKQNEADNKATENDLEVVNKTVDRLNKLTRTERNKMVSIQLFQYDKLYQLII